MRKQATLGGTHITPHCCGFFTSKHMGKGLSALTKIRFGKTGSDWYKNGGGTPGLSRGSARFLLPPVATENPKNP
jgi:hypothetical protein